MSSIPFLSIIIPVFNEEEILESSLLKNFEVLSKYSYSYEIIAVNDGSEDESRSILEKFSCSFSFAKVINHNENKGFGGAIRTGIQAANGKYIWCVPVDSPLTKETFEAFENHFGKADILVGYRKERKGYSWWMKINSIVFHFLISNLFNMSLKDYNWIHLYSNEIFRKGNIQIEYDGLFMLSEVLIKASRKGYTIKEFPVDQEQRLTGIASASKISNVLKTVRDILKFKLYSVKFKG